MEFFLDPKFKEEKEERIKLMMPYQINSRILEDSNILVMHDMPIHRGYEISAEMIEIPNSIIFDQAENRLHSEKAILLKLLKEV
jgi:ornithine carbamoyltransferase